jgi:hypothetical protein
MGKKETEQKRRFNAIQDTIRKEQLLRKEKEYREEFPAIKDAYDKYLELLALHGFYD